MQLNKATKNVSWKDCNLCEYSLVAYADGAVRERIATEKDFFFSRHQHDAAAAMQPHIMIANFLVKEQMEETLARWIQNICNLHPAFTVTLNNFSGWPPNTIYARVQDPQPLRQLAGALRMLDGFICANDCPPALLAERPRLELASGLSETLYEAALKEYARRSFHASFALKKLTLLKTDAGMNPCLVNTFVLPAAVPERD